jgi:hypothetical protein
LLLEQAESRVHEKVELLDPGLEFAGSEVVPELMQNDEDGEAQKELSGFNQSDHGGGSEGQRYSPFCGYLAPDS